MPRTELKEGKPVLRFGKPVLKSMVPDDLYMFFMDDERVALTLLSSTRIRVCTVFLSSCPDFMDLQTALGNHQWVELLRGQEDIVTLVVGEERQQVDASEAPHRVANTLNLADQLARVLWFDWTGVGKQVYLALLPGYLLEQDDYPCH
jgi:hypothetical protein